MWIETDKKGKIRYREYIKTLDGKRKVKSFTFEKDTAKNRKIATELFRQEQLIANSTINNDVTFFEIIELFRKNRMINFKHSTIYNYNYKFDRIKKNSYDIQINQINTRYIKQLLEDISSSNCTYNYNLQFIKSIIKYAYELDYIDNIEFLSKLKRKATETKEDRVLYFELEEVNAIKDKLRSPVHRNLVTFLTNTGLRIGECLALTFDDVEGDILTINKNLSQNNRTVSTTKTKAGTRKISLNKECLKIIKEQKIINNNNILLKNLDSKINIIFANTFNDYFNYNNLKFLFKRDLGYNIQFHLFRHTHASLCIEAGIPLEMISKRLGHNSESITKEIYIHKTKKMEQIEFEQFRKISF